MSRQLRCIGYVRVSTERQAGEVQTSLSDQEAAIRALAERFELTVDRWYRDEGASGASVEARPAFRQLLADCEATPKSARTPGLILVLNDSRFGRFPDPDEAAHWRFHLKRLGWIVRFCEGDDVEDVTFRHMIRAIGGAQASEYRRNIQRNARRGARGAAEQGFWTREAPIGYRRKVVHPAGSERVLEIGQHKAPNEKVKLTPHPQEAELVRWVFEQYASGGMSLEQLAGELLEKRPDRKWSRTVVNHLLRNEVYVGDVVGGRRPGDRTERLVTPERPRSEWYGKRNAHEAIVSRELFEAVQARLRENRKLGKGVRVDYLLTGILTCTYCDQHYTGGGHSALTGGRILRFYRDSGHNVCPGKVGTVSRHIIDDAVVSAIAGYVGHPSARRRIEREIDEQLSWAGETAVESVSSLRAARAKLEQKRERLVAAVAEGTLLQSEAGRAMEKIRAEIEDVETRLHVARFSSRRHTTAQEERDRLVKLALDFPTVAQRLAGPALRELVRPWLGYATFDKARRVLSLGIRPLPSFVLHNRPGPGSP